MAKRFLAALVMLASASTAHVRAEEAAKPEGTSLQTGTATYYGQKFEGRRTANGEVFRHAALTAAHATLPFGTLALITNVTTGKWVVVRITDRLPSKRAVVDLTRSAAAEIGMLAAGRVRVNVQILDPSAPPNQAAAPQAASDAIDFK